MWSESAYLGPVTYDWVLTQAGNPSLTMKVWVEDNKRRYEFSQGRQEVIQLVDYDARIMYIYFPDQNMAYRTDFNQAPQRPIEESESLQQIQPTILGTETIDGKDCLVIEWANENTVSKSWVWQDRKFPIRMEQVTPQGTTLMEWRNIQFGDISDSMFQLPPGVDIITLPSQ
ncbi:MAG: outer membrane lipoprotein-sorting protein, partial [Dehalococcoidia bacterium]|nr:outer membrane lipoprotein-sorting protein [Dehalococcoidia bacterium]